MSEVNAERLEPYKPPFSVWDLIKSHVPEKELPLVKSYLGESSIEYCLELRNELETLLEIWRDVGEQSEPPTITRSLASSILPDPPKLREMLIKEIHLLVKGIQEKNGTVSNTKYETSEKQVIQYAMLSQSSSTNYERPSTPLRRHQQDNVYTSPVKLKHIRRSINATNIDAVAPILQDAIEKECRALEHDIKFLQKSVEEEHDLASSRPSSPIQEPSIVKLRQVCKSLESQVMAAPATKPNSPASSSGQIKLPTPPSPNRVQLKPIESITHPSSLTRTQSLNQSPSLFRSSSSPLRNHLKTKYGIDAASHSNSLFNEANENSIEEPWFEPEWSRCMSNSPPATADSGVGSRPTTCDITALHERRRGLVSGSGGGHATESSGSDKQLVSDNGYQTSSSTEILNDFETSRLNETHSINLPQKMQPPQSSNDSRNKSISIVCRTAAKTIMPSPPKRDSTNPSRKSVSSRRYARKPLET